MGRFFLSFGIGPLRAVVPLNGRKRPARPASRPTPPPWTPTRTNTWVPPLALLVAVSAFLIAKYLV